jgi:hypothetical protein
MAAFRRGGRSVFRVVGIGSGKAWSWVIDRLELGLAAGSMWGRWGQVYGMCCTRARARVAYILETCPDVPHLPHLNWVGSSLA